MNESSQDFLGTGWKFPIEFRKSLKSVVMLTGEDDIRNSLDVLFATRVGERIMHSNYGTALETFVFMPVSKSTLTYMQAVVADEILFNEPRIVLNDVNISLSPEDPGVLIIQVDYKITATNNRYNYVYPFYINEATNLDR